MDLTFNQTAALVERARRRTLGADAPAVDAAFMALSAFARGKTTRAAAHALAALALVGESVEVSTLAR